MNKVKKANLLLLIVMVIMIFGPVVLQGLPAWADEYVFILLPVLLFALIQRRDFTKIFRLNGMNFQSLIIVIAISFLMQPFLMLISEAASLLLGDQLGAMMDMGPKYSFMMNMFALAITPAICEEALMRGVILDGYGDVSIKKAAIMNGVLFGMFHMNFHQFSYTFFMGIVLAYVVYITKSIWAGIIIHFINNATSVFMMSLSQSTASTAAAANNGQDNSWIVFTIIALVGFALVILLIKRLTKVNDVNLSAVNGKARGQAWKIININDINLHSKNIDFEDHDLENEIAVQEPKLFNWPIAFIIVIFMITSMMITLITIFM